MSSWLSVCCRLCETLSMSLVTRLSSSPRGCLSKYGSGSRLSLSSTSARSCRIGALHDAVEHVALQPGQQAGGDVQHQRQQQDLPEPGEVDAHARAARPSWRACRRSCRCPPPGRRRPPARAVVPAGSCLPITPEKMRSVACPRIFGPITLQRHADHGQRDDRRSGAAGAAGAGPSTAWPTARSSSTSRPACPRPSSTAGHCRADRPAAGNRLGVVPVVFWLMPAPRE